MSRAEVQVGLTNAAFKRGLDEMKGQLNEFKHHLQTAGLGTLAFMGIEGALEKADQIGGLAKKFNISAEEIQKFGYAAKQVGLDMETVARGGFKAFTEAQKALTPEGEASRKHFEELGISLKQLANLKGPADTMMLLADAVHESTDKHAAFAATAEIVGVRQASLISLFQQGSEAIKEQGEEANVLSDDTVKNLREAHHEVENLKNGFISLVGSVVSEFKPAIDAVLFAVQYGLTAIGRAAQASGSLLRGNLSEARAIATKANADLDAMMQKRKTAALREELFGSDKGTGEVEEAPQFDDKEEERRIERIKKLREEISEIDFQAQLKELTHAQKVIELMRQQEKLADEIDSFGDDEENLKIIKQIAELKRQQAEEQKGVTADKKKESDEADRKAKHLADLHKRLNEDLDKNDLDSLTKNSDKKKFLLQKEANLKEELSKIPDSDEEARLEKKSEIAKVQGDLIRLKPDKSKKDVLADEFAKIGGGGFVANEGSDPLLVENRKTNDILERIEQKLDPTESMNLEE